MKPSLQFRLSQHLTLTPQLQQSIRLLQLSTVELNQEIERLLMEKELLYLGFVYGKVPYPFYERWKKESNDVFCLRVRMKHRKAEARRRR